MEPGTRISYDFVATNFTTNGTTILQSQYNTTVLRNNASHFIVEERLEDANTSDWVQRRYDPLTRESLTFPGTYSWLWIPRNLTVGDTVPLASLNFTVAAVHNSWPFRGRVYTAIELAFQGANYTSDGFYDASSSLLLYSSSTMTGPDYTSVAEFYYDKTEVLLNWPDPLTPPGGGGLSSPVKSSIITQGWSRVFRPPYADGDAGITYLRTIGAANVYVYGVWGYDQTGYTGSDLASTAGSPFGRADVQSLGFMQSSQFALPYCANYRAVGEFTSDGLAIWIGHRDFFAPYTFTHIRIRLYYQQELIRVSPFSVEASLQITVFSVDESGWWIFQPEGATSWRGRYQLAAIGPIHLCPAETNRIMMSKLFVEHMVVVSGATIALARTWINARVLSMSIAEL